MRAVVLLAALLFGQSALAADLSAAKSLYASASYEDALAMLASLDAGDEFEQVHELRALCLLALGRNREAEETIERIVLHTPTYTIGDEVSPKLVSVFQDVRRRTLPTAVRSLYTKAKANYDGKRWSDAKREFEGLLALLGDPDMAAQQTALSDLRELGEGFLRLADSELGAEARRKQEAEAAERKRLADAEAATRAAEAAAAKAVVPAAAPATSPSAANANAPRPATAPGPAAATPGASAGRPSPTAAAVPVYTTADRDVTPPVEQRREFPRWSPPTRAMAMATQTGLLEIVIDEKGSVVAAAMAKPITPPYDSALIAAARGWRFAPARKDGQPVRYRQLLEVVLRPQQ
jgi:tetratricopeptide (TPR) repeat protein